MFPVFCVYVDSWRGIDGERLLSLSCVFISRKVCPLARLQALDEASTVFTFVCFYYVHLPTRKTQLQSSIPRSDRRFPWEDFDHFERHVTFWSCWSRLLVEDLSNIHLKKEMRNSFSLLQIILRILFNFLNPSALEAGRTRLGDSHALYVLCRFRDSISGRTLFCVSS
jgi:hypothetical protein